jgi:pyrimidine and pyridine-specific 5'-nucleotidase
MKDAGVVYPSNCFFVDDSAANVDKALDIGWTAVHVADDPVVSKFGHYQISNILELPTVLPEFWDEKSTTAALAGISSSEST